MAQPSISKYCDKFHEHPYRNPYTEKTIKINGPTYLGLVRECGKPPGGIKEIPMNLSLLTVRQLKRLGAEYSVRLSDLSRKSDIIDVLQQELDPEEITESLQKPLFRPFNMYGNMVSNQ